MFTVTLDKQSATFKRILGLLFSKYPKPVKGIDMTFGTGSLWWDLDDEIANGLYRVTQCDADPQWLHEEEIFGNFYNMYLSKFSSQKRFVKTEDNNLRDQNIILAATKKAQELTAKACLKTIIQKNIFTDDYSELGKHQFALFDPPYLYGNREAFDYPAGGTGEQFINKINKLSSSHITPMQLQGPRSWGANGLKKFVGNKNQEEFEKRVLKLNEKLPSVLENGGYLIVKVMDPRDKGELMKNHIIIDNILTEKRINPEAHFETTDIGIYIRQGATTFTTEKHFQNLHGYWCVYKSK